MNKNTTHIDAPKCKTLEHVRKYQNQNNPEYLDQTLDPYNWLVDKNNVKDNPEVIEYLTAENNYTASIMADTKQLQDDLFLEFKARIEETDTSAPWPHDGYAYYFRTVQDLEYSIFCRKPVQYLKDFSNPEEEIILDENILAKGHKFFSIGDAEISPCHNYLAYTADTVGNECYELFIKDIANNKTYSTNIKKISSGLDWSADGKTVFYLNLDSTLRPYQVMAYDWDSKLNSNQNNSFELFNEPDERFWVHLEITRSQKYILISSESKISTEIYYLPAKNININSNKLVKSIKPREQNVEYNVDHFYNPDNNNLSENRNGFYVLINSKSKPNYELYYTEISNLESNLESESNADTDTSQILSNWDLLIKHNKDTKLEQIDCFKNYAVLFTRSNGLNHLNLINNYNFDNYNPLDIKSKLNEEIYDLGPATNIMYDQEYYRFQYESLATPHSIYNMDLNNNLDLIKQDTVLNNYNRTDYISERIFVAADSSNPDIKIPVSIIYNKHKYNKNGQSPLLLYGYGSYGISIDPYFSYCRVSLLDRGIAFAVAHIRGGGELGDTWHHMGRLDCKANTFKDFITCAEYLINNNYTNPNKLVIQGGSAGGLLVGNVINQRPELFHSVIAEVPFVDCLNAMLDPSLPLTIVEYEEWGNPSEDIKAYEYIKSYTPYENIKAQNYPNLLINNSLEDIRVSYWEAAKWAAKLREFKTDNNILLLKTQMTAGHGGASGRYEALKEMAFNYSFILKTLAI